MTKISDLTAASVALGTEQIPYRLGGANGRLTSQQIADLVPTQQGSINVRDYPYLAVGDGVTDDYAAIVAAITAARAASKTLIIPDGTYKHSGTINWAYNNFKVMAFGNNAVFVHSGTGIAHNFSGMANYPASQGCTGGVFGGPGRIMIKGNPAGGTTRGVNIDNWHFGDMKVAIRDCATTLYGADTGIVGSSAVCTTFDVRISNNTDGAFLVQPGRGVDFSKPVACTFEKLIVEGVGAGSNMAVVLTGAINNSFRGGTVESNAAGGISEDITSSRNTYINVACEANVTTEWVLAGKFPVLINCTGAIAPSTFNSTGAILQGGTFQSVTNNDDTFYAINTAFWTVTTNNGTHTTILSPQGNAPPTAREQATSILHNKSIYTDNANTIGIAGRSLTAVTGTGSTVVMSVSPALTTPNLGTPSAAILTNATGTAAGLTAGNATLAATVTTNANLTGDVTSVGNATTLTNAPVIAKVLTGYVSGAGTISATDSILAAIQKLNGNDATNANLTGAITSVGNATSLGSFSSAALAAALTDEDGTGVVPFEATGTWTPADASGAALVFTAVNCRYTKIGNMMYAYGTFTMPATANGATLLISGLPANAANGTHAVIPSPVTNSVGVNAGLVIRPVANSSTFNIFQTATGVNAINSLLSSSVMTFNIAYPVT